MCCIEQLWRFREYTQGFFRPGPDPRDVVGSKSRNSMARILIADDSSVSRRMLRQLLEMDGWEVCGEAENGLEAVEKVATLKPDLVILDWNMPKMNGIQAANTIHTADPDMPLLLFTLEKIIPTLAEEARRVGFRGALAKGEGVFALSQAVDELLQGKTFFITTNHPEIAESAKPPGKSAEGDPPNAGTPPDDTDPVN